MYAPVCQRKAIRRQNGAVVVDEDGLDPQQLRDLTRVLASCTTKARQAVEQNVRAVGRD